MNRLDDPTQHPYLPPCGQEEGKDQCWYCGRPRGEHRCEQVGSEVRRMSRLDEIRARLEKATPGPWYVDSDDCKWDENAVLIANAPADLRYLLGEVERLQTENEFLRSKLPF